MKRSDGLWRFACGDVFVTECMHLSCLFLQDLRTSQLCHYQFFHKSKACCFSKISSLPDLTIPILRTTVNWELRTSQLCHCQFFHKGNACCFSKMSSLPDLTIPRYDHACTEWITHYKLYITCQPIFIIEIRKGLISVVVLKTTFHSSYDTWLAQPFLDILQTMVDVPQLHIAPSAVLIQRLRVHIACILITYSSPSNTSAFGYHPESDYMF